MFNTSGFGASGAGQHNPNKDTEVPQAPEDGVSSLRFSSTANYLAATSWDCSVRVWEISAASAPAFAGATVTGMSATPKAMIKHSHPLLCSAWSQDGSAIFAGGCDGQVKMWSLATNQTQQVAQHQGGVKELFFVKDENKIVTGSWDKTLKYWDLRSSNPIYTHPLNDKVYSMDLNGPLLVVATAGNGRQSNGMPNQDLVRVFDMRFPKKEFKTNQSQLKWQTRCVACFADQKGYLIGSIEGRVGVQNIDDSQTSKNFTFKCHRADSNVYAVNSIAVHPTYGTFVTAGSDGAYHFWDKDSKQRLKAMERCNQSISCGSFSQNGSIYAYAVSYDWSKGCQAYNPQRDKNYILLHAVTEADAKSRPKNSSSRVR